MAVHCSEATPRLDTPGSEDSTRGYIPTEEDAALGTCWEAHLGM